VLLLLGREAHALSGGTWTLNYDASSPNDIINALTEYNRSLYAGTCCANSIYVYDGTTWSLNFNTDNPASNLHVHSLAVFNGKLYAGTNYYSGGNFGRVWVYDGTTWSVSQDYSSDVQHYFSLAPYNGKLYAGTSPSGLVYEYDGTIWAQSFDAKDSSVSALGVYNGKLYAGTAPNGKIFQFTPTQVCGNGLLEPGEECDDGVVDPDEECDDGNGNNGDGCTTECEINFVPDCSKASANPSILWPPNHQGVNMNIIGVSDPDGDPLTITATGVFQDEPVAKVTGDGAGATSPDASSSPLQVRAERNGNRKTPGDGRVYFIKFTADDGMGGTCAGAVKVCVPHNQGQQPLCIDEGPLYNSLLP
jgi:cysteine-rich repeat protein